MDGQGNNYCEMPGEGASKPKRRGGQALVLLFLGVAGLGVYFGTSTPGAKRPLQVSGLFPKKIPDSAKGPEDTIDVNGRYCLRCAMPLPERSDREYVSRTDCGNQTPIEHPEVAFKPLVSFTRPASEGHNATNGFCELNTVRECADALYNKDFLFQAKATLDTQKNFDPTFCYLSGFLAPEFVKLQHDFEGMRAKSAEICNSEKYLKFHWNTTMTLNDMFQAFTPAKLRGFPTEEEAAFTTAYNCAMGSAGCDIAYCAYSFCILGGDEEGNVKIGKYGECEGWDPVRGMPMPKPMIQV